MIGFFKLRWQEMYDSCFENTQIMAYLIIVMRILIVALLKMLQLILMTIVFIMVMPFELIMRVNLKIINLIKGKDLSFFDSGEE